MSAEPTTLPYILALLQVAQFVAIVVLWLRKPGQDASEQVSQARTESRESVALVKARVDVIEERVRHMPTSDELRELEGQLSGIKERLSGLDDTAKNTRQAVQRIEDFLRANR